MYCEISTTDRASGWRWSRGWNLFGLFSLLYLLYFLWFNLFLWCKMSMDINLNIATFGAAWRCHYVKSPWKVKFPSSDQSQYTLTLFSLLCVRFTSTLPLVSQLVERFRSHFKGSRVKCFENDKMIDFTICSQSSGAALAEQGERKSLSCFPPYFVSYYKCVCVTCLLIFIHCMSSCCCNGKDCFSTVFPTCP